MRVATLAAAARHRSAPWLKGEPVGSLASPACHRPTPLPLFLSHLAHPPRLLHTYTSTLHIHALTISSQRLAKSGPRAPKRRHRPSGTPPSARRRLRLRCRQRRRTSERALTRGVFTVVDIGHVLCMSEPRVMRECIGYHCYEGVHLVQGSSSNAKASWGGARGMC